MCSVLLFCVVLFVTALSKVQGNGYYTIVAPGSFRPNSKYQMSLATTGIQEPMEVLITLTKGNYYKLEKRATVPPNSPTIVVLEIGDLEFNSNNCKIQVQGLTGIIFSESAPIMMSPNRNMVFIQTDKAMYKPGDRIHFRILIVDPETKPLNLGNQSVEVYIQDPRGNKIKQWQISKLENGVFKGDLKLADEPAYGYWDMQVIRVGNNMLHGGKHWQVAEYVLPKFEVRTSQPVFNTYKSGKVIFAVEAKYTSGKPVKGTVTVRINNPEFHSWSPWGSMGQAPERYMYKIIPIDGKGIIELDMQELKISLSSYIQYQHYELTVLEELTGNTQKKEISIPIYERDYQIQTISDSSNFKPGMQFSFYVKVIRPDDKPIIDQQNPVICSYGFDGATKTDLSVTLNDQGMAFFSFPAPLTASNLEFFIKYRDIQLPAIYMSKAVSESNNYMQVIVLTKPLDIFKSVRVQVKATEGMKYFYYQVIGKDGVLVTSRVNSFNMKVFVFSFWATFAMVPEVALVVYYYRSNGEIVADRAKLRFNNRLDNYANIKLSATQVEPGKPVDITVDTKCNSYVGLLGIDQSVKLLASGNDIDKNRVFTELSSYYYGWFRSYPEVPSSVLQENSLVWQASYNQLVETGAIFFTNAKKYELTQLGSMAAQQSSLQAKKKKSSPNSVPVATNDNGDVSIDPVTIRKDFPETWIWEDAMNENCDPIKWTKKVPGTITSWLITAFSLNQANGLGLNDSPTSLQVFRPFFISITLPYSIKRGEKLTLSIQIFNYLPSDQDVLVTMTNEAGNFEFTDDTDSNYESSDSRMNLVTVKSNSGATITLTVTAKKFGYLPVRITARCEVAGDTIEQLLLVEPEGTPVYVNKAVLLDLRTVNTVSVPFFIDTPEGASLDSTSAQVSVFGDIMGTAIQNLGSHIRMPGGCGEQNLANFMVNVLLAEYLKKNQKLSTDILVDIVSKLEAGYQHQLQYQRSDGAFAASLNSPGSTWLTANAVRFFAEAKSYITIDDGVLNRALNWLMTQQSDNGRFIHSRGYILSEDLGSDANKGAGLTAHVLLALLAQSNAASQYGNAIRKSTDYIIEQLKTVNHVYSLALAAYALQKQAHPSAAEILKKLNEKAEVKSGFMWWPDARETEVTAIALATYAEAGLNAEALPIVQWLIQKRNSLGGYISTQDTLLGILGLTKISNQLFTNESSLDINLSYKPDGLFNFKVTRENAFAVQSFVLPLNTKSINFDCSGSGTAVAQVSYRYYIVVPEPTPRFNLNVKVLDSVKVGNLRLNICNSFVTDEKAKTSSMAIVEVTFPSGFTFYRDSLAKLRSATGITRVETKDQDTVLIIYYDSIGESEVCFDAEAVKTSNVAFLKPVPVKVYDYYDNSRRARKFYNLASLNGLAA